MQQQILSLGTGQDINKFHFEGVQLTHQLNMCQAIPTGVAFPILFLAAPIGIPVMYKVAVLSVLYNAFQNATGGLQPWLLKCLTGLSLAAIKS